MKFEEILIEIMVLEKGAIELLRRKSGRFRFPIYINENLYNTMLIDDQLRFLGYKEINTLKLSGAVKNGETYILAVNGG